MLSNSASSPFITGHQLKPPSLSALQHMLLAECSPRHQPHTGVTRSSYRRQHKIRVLAFYRAFHARALPSFRTFSFLPHCSCPQAPAVSIAFSTCTSFFLKWLFQAGSAQARATPASTDGTCPACLAVLLQEGPTFAGYCCGVKKAPLYFLSQSSLFISAFLLLTRQPASATAPLS